MKTLYTFLVIIFITNCLSSQCSISNLTTTTAQECDEFEEYYLELDFDFADVGTSGFVVWSSYTTDTFQYADLPVTLGPFPGYCGEFMDFEVADIDNPGCVQGLIPALECCENQRTIISNLDGFVECNEDETFELTVTFDDEESSSLGYMIWVKAYPLIGDDYTFGPFEFTGSNTQTVSIPEVANCQEGYKVTVYDALEGLNGTTANVSIDIDACCSTPECSLSNITYDELLCENDGLIVFYGIDFDTTDVGSAFQIFIDDELQYSSFAYDLPMAGIEFLCPGAEVFDFKICDLDNPDCCVEVVLEHPCFDTCDGCLIYEFYNNTELVCEDGLMVAEWYIHSENTSELGYDIFLEGEFVTFVDYVEDSGPYFFDLPAVETEYATVTACDNDNPDCCSSWEFLNPCFETSEDCELFDLTVEVSDCVQGVAVATIDFEYTGTTSEFFDFDIPGLTSGIYLYADLPLSIDIENMTDDFLELFITDSENSDCSLFSTFENPCFEEVVECDIFSIDFTSNPACENNQIVTEWYIFSEGTSESGFDISINGEFLTFVEYDGEGPYDFDIPNPETQLFTITACDNDDADCCYSWELENPCYEAPTDECEITTVDVVGDLECVAGEVVFGTWVVVAEGGSGAGFDFFVDDEFLYTSSLQGNNEYIMEFFVDVNNPFFTWQVCDAEYEDCCWITEYENPCYEAAVDCDISNITFSSTGCAAESGLIFIENILVEGSNTSDSYDLYLDDEYNSTFTYGELYTIEFPCDAVGDVYTITVCDTEYSDCCATLTLDNACAGQCDPECLLYDLVAVPTECAEGEFDLVIDFLYTGVTDSFDLLLNSEHQGTYSYTELPITITGLEGICDLEYEISVFDTDDDGCSRTIVIPPVCCEDECSIFSIDFTSNPACENNQIVTEWYIFSEGTSESGFDISINGEFLTFVEYDGEGPYDFDIPNPETQLFTITACDNDDADCCYSWELENPCYEESGNCELTSFTVAAVDCASEYILLEDILVEGEGTSDGYELTIGDEIFGIFQYGVSIAALEIFCSDVESEEFELTACDTESGDCCISILLDNPCFEDCGNDCSITEVVAEVLSCDDGEFSVIVDFGYSGAGGSFELRGNGNLYGTYNYGDAPITLTGLAADCEVEYEFVVVDVENEDCFGDTGIGVVCCEGEECILFSIDFTDIPSCVNNQIVTEWYVSAENTSESGFDFFINGEFLIYVEYDGEGPYDFDIPNPETEVYSITACDNDNPDCCYTWELENPCYEAALDCEIGILTAEVTACEGDLFDVVIDFEHDGTGQSFILAGNGISYGTYSYDELPITLASLEADCLQEYEFVATDSDDTDCSNFVELGIVCCEEGILQSIVFDVSTVDDSIYYLMLTVNENLTIGCSYTVYLNGVLQGILDSLETDIEVGPIFCEDTSPYTLSFVNNCTGQEFLLPLDVSDYDCALVSVVDQSIEPEILWSLGSKSAIITLPTVGHMSVTIYDTDGRVIKRNDYQDQQVMLDYNELPAGLYILSVYQHSTSQFSSKKILVID